MSADTIEWQDFERVELRVDQFSGAVLRENRDD